MGFDLLIRPFLCEADGQRATSLSVLVTVKAKDMTNRQLMLLELAAKSTMPQNMAYA